MVDAVVEDRVLVRVVVCGVVVWVVGAGVVVVVVALSTGSGFKCFAIVVMF